MTDQTPALLAAERRAHVLASLERDGAVRVAQLMDELGVAPVTLRRDLAQMEREGLLVRVHGGAVPTAGSLDELDAAVSAPGTRAGSIAMLVPSLTFYYPTVVRGAETEAARHGMRVVVRGASYELQDERPVLERLVDTEGVRGLVLAPNTDTPHAQDVVQWLAECGVPNVLVERDAVVQPEGSPVENVTTDHALGAMLAARHLAALGHRRVGLIIARDSPTSRKIAAGWHAACAELGLTPADQFETSLPPRTSPDFSDVVDSTLDAALANGVTAILVHSDPEAMAFVDLALNRGLSVPRDLSVVAYDDEVAEIFTPPLTAVCPPRVAVGRAAVDLVVRRLEDPTRPVHRVVLNPTLNVRGSTAPPRSA
ncbi:DeoR/GlpR family transcriptional regulator [Microbacterium sp. NEAU-LLC]|uniref:DeoR/GlpR family transcriptional regulator n=1 Tax=Microbacterium helvum TaxID=2773713 RepID=A0ABR8NVK4_9MICO|nr:substrate-binding domain-containing protein [Microbacterium helvum]MBD3943091.1 DeoR/GlpR family transcriptional regulator [Microbacterium helvum]